MNRRTRWMLVAVFAAFLVGLPSLASAAGSVFDFDSAEYSVGENDGSVTIHVLRSGSLAGAATVATYKEVLTRGLTRIVATSASRLTTT